MRIVEKLLYGIGGLLALILLFIALCNHNPDIAVKIGERLKKPDEATETKMPEEGQAGNFVIKTTVTQGEQPAAESPTSDDDDAEKKLKIPPKVAALTGYIPIKSIGTEVTQAKADEILETLSKGEIGEKLTFDEEFYPYYAMLNDTQSALSSAVYECGCDAEEFFAGDGYYGD